MGCAAHRDRSEGFNYLVLGHEAAGKTAIALALNGRKIEDAEPSMVLINVTEIESESRTKLTFTELGGSEDYRKMWHEEFAEEYDAIVFVIDGNNTAEYLSAKRTLIDVLKSPVMEIQHIPVLVIVNKADLEVKIDVNELRETLKTHTAGHRNYSKVFISSATKPETLKAAFDDLYAHFHPACVLVDSRYKDEKTHEKHSSSARSDQAVHGGEAKK